MRKGQGLGVGGQKSIQKRDENAEKDANFQRQGERDEWESLTIELART